MKRQGSKLGKLLKNLRVQHATNARWANTTPRQRKAFMKKVRAGRSTHRLVGAWAPVTLPQPNVDSRFMFNDEKKRWETGEGEPINLQVPAVAPIAEAALAAHVEALKQEIHTLKLEIAGLEDALKFVKFDKHEATVRANSLQQQLEGVLWAVAEMKKGGK